MTCLSRSAFPFSLTAAALLLQGCQSYTIVQRNFFSDEDGNLVTVAYGRSDSDHVNTFVSPVNGQELEFKSKLVVRVTMPDVRRYWRERDPQTGRRISKSRIICEADAFTAWQCMNFLQSGTMYGTDDGEWKALVHGFSLSVFRRDGQGRYPEVFRGVLVGTPQSDVKKDNRWRDMKVREKKYIPR